ncbi:MAG: zf-HC2 domain-containing protein [Dehalococcoidia bacterium]
MFGRGQKNECERVRERFSAFLDGCLDHVEEDAVRYHVGRCEQCRSELESIDATRELLQWMPSENVPRHFALPEVWRGWVRDPLSVRSMNALRVAAAAVMVAFVVLLAADFSGAFYTQVEPQVTSQYSATPSGETLSSEEQTSEAPSSDEEGSDSDSESSGLKEATQPDPSDSRGPLGITGVPEEVPDEAEGDSSLPEAREVVESEPYSWLYPSEIAAFAVLVVLGGMYFWAWRERRRLAHTREPD